MSKLQRSLVVAAVFGMIAFVPAIAQKKLKTSHELYGCWSRDLSDDGFSDLCIGNRNRFSSVWTSVRYKEGFGAEGLFSTREGRSMDLVSLPGDGWGQNALRTCQYAIDVDELTLTGCDFAGSWKRTCSRVNDDLRCATTAPQPPARSGGAPRAER